MAPKYRQEILLKVLGYFVQYDFLEEEEVIFLVNHVTTIIDYFHATIKEYTIFLTPEDFHRVKIVEDLVTGSGMGMGCGSGIWDLALGCCRIPNPRHREISLRCELERYNVAIISTDNLKPLLYFIQLINRFYRRYPENRLIQECFVEISKILAREHYDGNGNGTKKREYREYHHLYDLKPKEYSFYENQILPNILYKKIRLSKMIQFISLEHYAHKKCEYMLRSFSQIAEELGAIRIKIKYKYDHQQEKIRDREITLGRGAGISLGMKRSARESEGNNLNFNFTYSNNNYMNLNEYFLNDKILNENKFLLCKEDFESNIELKYLISARCKNLIEKYYTQFKHQTMNSVEMRIYTILREFELEFQWNRMKSESIEITLQIDFLNILESRNLIDGGNIYPLKEGYIYLKNILDHDHDHHYAEDCNKPSNKEEDDDSLLLCAPLRGANRVEFESSEKMEVLGKVHGKDSGKRFIKYVNFLKAHLYCIQNGHIYLAYDYGYKKDVMKIYHQAIEMNFTEDEMIRYVEDYWTNHCEWYHFIMLRDVILKGSDNVCDKLHFITFQYMNIFHRKYHLLEMMEEQLKKIVPKMIHQYIDEAIRRFAMNEYTHEDMIDYNSDDEKRMDQIKHQERVSRKRFSVSGRNINPIPVPSPSPVPVPVPVPVHTPSDADLQAILPPTIYEKVFKNNHRKEMEKAHVTFVDFFSNAVQGYQWIEDDDGGENNGKREKMICSAYRQYNQLSMDTTKNGKVMMGDQFDSELFKEHLEKNGFKARLIELVIKGAKGTFYYENGISENVESPERLEEIMMTVITYYYRSMIQVLQESCIHRMVNIEKYKMIDVMTLIREIVQTTSKWYIHKYRYIHNQYQDKSLSPGGWGVSRHHHAADHTMGVRNIMGSVTGMYDSLQKHADHDHSSPIQIPGTGDSLLMSEQIAAPFQGAKRVGRNSLNGPGPDLSILALRLRLEQIDRKSSPHSGNEDGAVDANMEVTKGKDLSMFEDRSSEEDHSENGYGKSCRKLSLIAESEMIFVKFIIKYIHNGLDSSIMGGNGNGNSTKSLYTDVSEERIREIMDVEIPKERRFVNYRKHRVYFTHENLLTVIDRLRKTSEKQEI